MYGVMIYWCPIFRVFRKIQRIRWAGSDGAGYATDTLSSLLLLWLGFWAAEVEGLPGRPA